MSFFFFLHLVRLPPRQHAPETAREVERRTIVKRVPRIFRRRLIGSAAISRLWWWKTSIGIRFFFTNLVIPGKFRQPVWGEAFFLLAVLKFFAFCHLT